MHHLHAVVSFFFFLIPDHRVANEGAKEICDYKLKCVNAFTERIELFFGDGNRAQWDHARDLTECRYYLDERSGERGTRRREYSEISCNPRDVRFADTLNGIYPGDRMPRSSAFQRERVVSVRGKRKKGLRESGRKKRQGLQPSCTNVKNHWA